MNGMSAFDSYCKRRGYSSNEDMARMNVEYGIFYMKRKPSKEEEALLLAVHREPKLPQVYLEQAQYTPLRVEMFSNRIDRRDILDCISPENQDIRDRIFDVDDIYLDRKPRKLVRKKWITHIAASFGLEVL